MYPLFISDPRIWGKITVLGLEHRLAGGSGCREVIMFSLELGVLAVNAALKNLPSVVLSPSCAGAC